MVKQKIGTVKLNIWQGTTKKNMKKEIKKVPKENGMANAKNILCVSIYYSINSALN